MSITSVPSPIASSHSSNHANSTTNAVGQVNKNDAANFKALMGTEATSAESNSAEGAISEDEFMKKFMIDMIHMGAASAKQAIDDMPKD